MDLKMHAKSSLKCDLSKVKQTVYPGDLYSLEVSLHQRVVDEYADDVYDSLAALSKANLPRMELYDQQPSLSRDVRLRLINFALRMSVRLKLIPFVFYRAVKIFDRYCCERVVTLDLAQLIITVCLWIAAKFQGGNNHYVNMASIDQISCFKTITDLGYGSGCRFKGPTERYRLPRLHELVKLCGTKCNYSKYQFKQMELHILETLGWSFNDPSIEECIISSDDFNINNKSEFFSIKTYLSYISLHSYELIGVSVFDMGQVIVDFINDVLSVSKEDPCFQRVNDTVSSHSSRMDPEYYRYIRHHLVRAILANSYSILNLFNSKGPHRVYQLAVYFHSQLSLALLGKMYHYAYNPPPSSLETIFDDMSSPTSTLTNHSSERSVDSSTIFSVAPSTSTIASSPVTSVGYKTP